MIADPDEYFARGCGRCDRFGTPDCSTRRWLAGLTELRRICRDMGLAETAKWGHPCYMHAGRNVALLGAFRDDFRLSFMNAALLSDPEGVLERAGPATQTADFIRFTENGDVARREDLLRAYLREAMDHAEAGRRPERSAPDEPDMPEELIAALDADPELAEAFQALTPGRRRSYAIVLGAAKKSRTRVQRIAKLRPRILAGKGANER